MAPVIFMPGTVHVELNHAGLTYMKCTACEYGLVFERICQYIQLAKGNALAFSTCLGSRSTYLIVERWVHAHTTQDSPDVVPMAILVLEVCT